MSNYDYNRLTEDLRLVKGLAAWPWRVFPKYLVARIAKSIDRIGSERKVIVFARTGELTVKNDRGEVGGGE